MRKLPTGTSWEKKEVRAPLVAKLYNMIKAGVDRLDQLMAAVWPSVHSKDYHKWCEPIR